MVTEGLTNKEIAFQLGLVEGTIKMHLFRLFSKLKVQNRTQAAVWWSRGEYYEKNPDNAMYSNYVESLRANG
jgi:DNA-binding NarL/FixJ family response regulator